MTTDSASSSGEGGCSGENASFQMVVAFGADQGVVGRVAEHRVVAAFANQDVGAGAAEYPVVGFAAAQAVGAQAS